ncbi:MAG: ribosome biogenesis GTPase Der [Planctomycetota bacterium]|jgi:GTP-binding protein
MLPIVAIVGRPNVGKSTLLNTLAGKRISIVEEMAGVTRDRVTAVIEWEGGRFEVMDTGGIGMVDVADIAGHVEEQIDLALSEADAVIFLTDVREGVNPLDRRIADRLRRLERPVIVVANKAETPELEIAAVDFHELGLGDPVAISAQNRIGTGDLLDRVLAVLPETEDEDRAEGLKIALVGRRNSGKSTFLNRVAGEERLIVSEYPGTTRDSVDVRVSVGDRVCTLIDTAGVQRRQRISGTIEYLSQHRTERSVRRADAVLLLLDVTVEVGELDKRIADYSLSQFKPTILVANKWDLVPGRSTEDFVEYLGAKLPGLHFAPLVFASARTGQKVIECLDLAEELVAQARVRVGTGELNRILRESLEERSPRVKKSRVPKLFYASQVGVEPPTIVAFVNDPDLFNPSYRRFLEGRIRSTFPFPEIPIRLILRERRQSK